MEDESHSIIIREHSICQYHTSDVWYNMYSIVCKYWDKTMRETYLLEYQLIVLKSIFTRQPTRPKVIHFVPHSQIQIPKSYRSSYIRRRKMLVTRQTPRPVLFLGKFVVNIDIKVAELLRRTAQRIYDTAVKIATSLMKNKCTDAHVNGLSSHSTTSFKPDTLCTNKLWIPSSRRGCRLLAVCFEATIQKVFSKAIEEKGGKGLLRL